MNNSGIEPIDFKVLIKQEKVEDTTVGGIIIAPQTLEKEQWRVCKAEVIDVGPRAFFDHPPERTPGIGDRVIIREFAGFKFDGKDGEEYHIVQDKDIMALWREA